jgi:hypothetical protein
LFWGLRPTLRAKHCICPSFDRREKHWPLWWPLQYLDFVVLKLFCHNFGNMLGVIVHLEDPFATKL